MEKLSIDSLFGLKSPKAVLNVIKQAGVEGTEEGLTTIANTLADGLIMGDRSELQPHKRNLMALGYREAEAEKIALKEWGLGLLTDVAGGMLSGGAFGSAKTTVDTYGNRNAVDVHPEMAYDSIREELDFERQFMDGFNAEEELHDGKERLYLRNGSQRDGGTNSGGSIFAMEAGAGRDQSRQTETQSADGGTAALSYGQKVSAASLGIPGGSAEANIHVVTGGETAATRAAMKTAKDNGLQLTLFTGGNLQITNESGKTDSVRGYISGDKAFVRADHPAYTADQIMRHEAGHARIARGEIDVRQIRERIRQRYGIRRTNELSRLYTAAYEGSGLNADEIWEEVVCDSLGDMNIFRELPKGNVVDGMLQAEKESAEAETRMTRGPPNDGADVPGKMSRSNLIGKHFPFFNESRSEANQLATRWAHQDDVKAGDQNVFSYHGSWYLVEAFDNADMGYQIVEKLTKKQYDAYLKEVRENDDVSGVQKSLSSLSELDREREWTEGRKYRTDFTHTEQRGENLEVRPMGEKKNERRKTTSDRNGDLQGSSAGGEDGRKAKLSIETPIEPLQTKIVHYDGDQETLQRLQAQIKEFLIQYERVIKEAEMERAFLQGFDSEE